MNALRLHVALCLLASIAGVMSARPARAGAPAMTVYVVNGLTRVRPTDAPPDAAVTIAAIQAARNEYEPFQVVVRAGAGGLAGVDMAVSDLHGEGGTLILRRHVALFREHFIAVVKPSPRSREGAGWYPDALIPFERPTGGMPPSPDAAPNARFVAAPFDVPPNTNQPVWVDVFVPAQAAPGRYTGAVTVTVPNQPSVTVPIELTVWDFMLPMTPSLRTNFGGFGQRMAAAHGVANNLPAFSVIERRYSEALAAHRLCPLIPNTLRPKVNADGSIDATQTHAALKIWMDRFHVTGFPLCLLGSDPLGKYRERSIRHLQAMYAYLKANGWEKYAYVSLPDEPNDAAAYEQVRERAALIHAAQPGIKVLCTEQPTPSDPRWGSLVGSVDIWAPLWALHDEQAGAERLAAGEELWSYTALCQGKAETPFWELDFPLLNYRIPMWMSWRSGMTGLIYWSTTCWDRAGDVWTNPRTYNEFNGEGMLFYPGTEAGFDGPVASMRLKQIREGMEDYEYLKLLAARDPKLAEEMVLRLTRGWTDWDADPAHLLATRELIAEQIVGRR
jgi:Glycoside hydrolase 123, catalytic domain/Glycoside hydrolase 123 N-terminal domain